MKILTLPEKDRWTVVKHDYIIVYYGMVQKENKQGNPVGGKPVFVGRQLVRDRSKY